MSKKVISSIIIPAHGRVDLLERAIISIVNSRGAENTEIIVIDDYSSPPLKTSQLRPQDQLIRTEKKTGAAVARNIGITASKGEVIYLLDSDDFIVERDFDQEYNQVVGSNFVWFSQIKSQGYQSNYPETINTENYLKYIFYKYPHITQTSSLCFEKSMNLSFDEALPKHQDWDFVFNQVLNKGINLQQLDSMIFFDRGDKTSLSRTYTPHKSDPWFAKLTKQQAQLDLDIKIIEYYLFAHYLSRYSWIRFSSQSINLLWQRKTTVRLVLIKIYHRLNQLPSYFSKTGFT
jgi:glycosyltransferase involved in cell wall biosynthesis